MLLLMVILTLLLITNEFAHYFAGNFVNSSSNVMLNNKFETVYKENAGSVEKQFVLVLLQTILR